MVSTYHEELMSKKIKALEDRMDKMGKPQSAKGIKALQERVEELEDKVEDLESTPVSPAPDPVVPED